MKKRKYLRKTILLLPLVAAIGLLFTACSSDDENKAVPEEPTVELDADTIQIYDGIGVILQLLNSKDQAVTTFKEGEDIIIALKLANYRSEDVFLRHDEDLVGPNVFELFTKEGLSLGVPWDEIGSPTLGTQINPNDFTTISCAAFGKRNDDGSYRYDPKKSRIVFLRTKDHDALSKGRYYVKFKIDLNEWTGVESEYTNDKAKIVECKKEFEIV